MREFKINKIASRDTKYRKVCITSHLNMRPCIVTSGWWTNKLVGWWAGNEDLRFNFCHRIDRAKGLLITNDDVEF